MIDSDNQPTQILFTGQFKLDRPHFEECYDQSRLGQPKHNIRLPYAASFIFGGMALLLYTTIEGYIGAFILGLGLLEILSGYFHRSWWLTRQMFSRRANGQVTITLNSEGITTQTDYGSSQLAWEDVQSYSETDQGYMLAVKTGEKSYLSKAIFSDEARSYLAEQLPESTSN